MTSEEAYWAGLTPEDFEDEPERPDSEYCSHCGKAFEEFADLGCEYCDRRHPGFGTTE